MKVKKKWDPFWVISLSILSFVIVFLIVKTVYENKTLENSSFVTGRLKERIQSTAKDGPRAVFGYSVDGVYYDIEVWGNFEDSTRHDYYCIEYSIDNPSVARLAEKSDCW